MCDAEIFHKISPVTLRRNFSLKHENFHFTISCQKGKMKIFSCFPLRLLLIVRVAIFFSWRRRRDDRENFIFISTQLTEFSSLNDRKFCVYYSQSLDDDVGKFIQINLIVTIKIEIFMILFSSVSFSILFQFYF